MRNLFRWNRFGFTLVELLLTSVILGIISLAIVSSFASGLKVYEKAKNHTQTRPDVLISLEKMERDLRNAIDSSEIDFIGKRENISFAALTKEGKLGRIIYYVKGARDMLTREEQEYPDAVLGVKKGKGKVREYVSIKDIDFSYYYRDPETREYKWKDSWEAEEEEEEPRDTPDEKDRLPLGVKIDLSYKEGRNYIALTRSVLIPAGYRGPDLEGEG